MRAAQWSSHDRMKHLATQLARIQSLPPATMPLSAPPWMTSAFSADTEEEFRDVATATRPTGFYTRYGNPSVRGFEDAVALLEGAPAALATPSGMAAICAAVLTACPPGGRILAQDAHYGGADGLLNLMHGTFGREVVRLPTGDLNALADCLARGADAVLLESPANPLLEVTDLAAAAELCRSHGAISIVDNTVATPAAQNPFALGCDLVVHSATKTIAGHADVTAGIVCGPAALIERVWRLTHISGACLDPFSAWLALRGLRTFHMRSNRHAATALTIAHAVESEGRVAAVHYPGLASHPSHEIAARQMRSFGGLVSLDLGDEDAALAFVQRFGSARRSASFGGPATLIVHPASMWAGVENVSPRVSTGIVRIGVGLESPEDLLDELRGALVG